ncbi:MAG: hypothetical protein AB7P03_30120 [Kofleriaceae bacterium]
MTDCRAGVSFSPTRSYNHKLSSSGASPNIHWPSDELGDAAPAARQVHEHRPA